MADINLWAVLLAAASAFLLGGIWYGPLFKHAWCREAGVEQIDVGPRGALIAFRHEPPGLEAFLDRTEGARRREDGNLVVPLAEESSARLAAARLLLRGLAGG